MNGKYSVFDDIEKFIISLKDNTRLDVNRENLQDVKKLLDDYDVDMTISLLESNLTLEFSSSHTPYIYTSGINLDWSNIVDKLGTKYLYGGFSLIGIDPSIAFPSSFWKVYNDKIENKNQEKDLESLAYFQSSAHGNDGTFGCFYRKPKEYPFPIYFYDNGVYFPMSLNLDEYYEAMLFCKAVVLWQYFYIDPKEIVTTLKNEKCNNWISLYDDLPNNPSRVEGLIKHMNILIEQFPVLFPDFDVSFFEEKRDSLVKEYNES